MNKKKRAEISAFYDLYKKEKGENGILMLMEKDIGNNRGKYVLHV